MSSEQSGSCPARDQVPLSGLGESAVALTEARLTAEIRRMNEQDPRACDRPGASRDDSELVKHAIARVKEGDEIAIRFLYVRFGERVRRYVRRIVRDPHEAEDVTQSVFLKLMSARHAYEPRAAPFTAWLFRVAHNAAVDSVRAKRSIPSDNVRAIDERRDYAAFEHRESLKRALVRVPHDQREVLVLRYVVGLRPQEIAARLHRTRSSVEGLQHRGRRALEAGLRELEVTPLSA
jgi:RNA polymerase sigma-70 factor (ECF subfamily)